MKSLKLAMLLLAVFLIIAFPADTWAHSKLQSSVPAADAKVTEAVQELSLSFNEKIDSTLSTLMITNDKGEKIETAEVIVEESHLKASLGSPLDSGTYTVEWKIVGRDGHPVKGEYAFQVDALKETPNAEKDNAGENAAEQQVNNPAGSETEDTGKGAPSETPTDTAEQDTSAEQPQSSPASDESGTGNTLWIVLIVVVAAVGGYFVLKQSRKRR